MADFSYEVWDPPGISTFVKKVAGLRPVQADGTLYRRQVGRGSFTLPADYDRLDDIVYVDPDDHSNDVASLVRVYRGADLIQEVLINESPNVVSGQPAVIAGDSVEAVMDWATVEAWDWTGAADETSQFPDWIYGGRNVLVDPTFADPGCQPLILGFWTAATSGTFTLTFDGATTAGIAYNAASSAVTTAVEALGTVNDVLVEGSGSEANPWKITFVDPCYPASFTYSSGTLSGDTLHAIGFQDGLTAPQGWTKAQRLRDGSEYGIYLHGSAGFNVETLPAATPAGTTTGLMFNGATPIGFSFPGVQTVPSVKSAGLYQAGVWVYVDAAGSYPMRMILRAPSEEPLIASSGWPSTTVSGQTWTLLSATDVTIPDWLTQAIFRVSYVGTANPPKIYVTDAYLNEGMAADTPGQIMLDLLADAQSDHSASAFPRQTIDFVNASFDATNDTGGNAWTDSELSVTIPRGMTYRKVLERVFGGLAYEYSLTPTVGTPGEWDLNVWNPDGRGTDHSSADTPSLLLGQGTVAGSATRTIPRANIVHAEGAQQYFSRTQDSASYGTVGRREGYISDPSYSAAQVEAWVDKQLARFLDASFQPRFDLVDSDAWPVPVVDYGLADSLNVDLADGGGKISRDVEAVSWRESDGVVWSVHTGEAQFDPISSVGGGSIGGGSVAASGPVDEGVRRLIDVFDMRLPYQQATAASPGGGGGDPSIFIAASDASSYEKDIANLQCDGTADHEQIMQAMEALRASLNPFGRIVLSSGTFVADLGAIDLSGDIHLHGMGKFTTVLNGTGTGGAVVTLSDFSGDYHISDLSITSSGCSTDHCVDHGGASLTMINVNLGFGTQGLHVAGNHVTMINVDSQSCNYFVYAESAGYTVLQMTDCYGDGYVYLDNMVSVTISNCLLGGSIVGLDPRGWSIAGNQWRAGSIWSSALIELGGGSGGDTLEDGCEVSGNVATIDLGYPFLSADSVLRLVVSDNISVGANVVLANCPNPKVSDNQISEPYDTALSLTSCDRANVTGNVLSYNSGGSASEDLITIVTSDRVLVEANTLIPSPGTPRYGVNVVSGECNMVVGNDLADHNDYGTDALGDTGSNTQLTYPGSMTYGDNFTDCGSGS